jgi:hypothetical protein
MKLINRDIDIDNLPPAATCLCPRCVKPMALMWENAKFDDEGWCKEIATVFHCWDCDEDREMTCQYSSTGEVLHTEVRRFFFG